MRIIGLSVVALLVLGCSKKSDPTQNPTPTSGTDAANPTPAPSPDVVTKTKKALQGKWNLSHGVTLEVTGDQTKVADPKGELGDPGTKEGPLSIESATAFGAGNRKFAFLQADDVTYLAAGAQITPVPDLQKFEVSWGKNTLRYTGAAKCRFISKNPDLGVDIDEDRDCKFAEEDGQKVFKWRASGSEHTMYVVKNHLLIAFGILSINDLIAKRDAGGPADSGSSSDEDKAGSSN